MEAEYLVTGGDGDPPERPCSSGVMEVAFTVMEILDGSEITTVVDALVRQMAMKMILGAGRWSADRPYCSTLSCLMERDMSGCVDFARYAAAYAIRTLLCKDPSEPLSEHLQYVVAYVDEIVGEANSR